MSQLPSSWNESSLADVAHIEMGQSPDGQATNTNGKGLPLIGGAADFSDGNIVPSRYTTDPTKVCKPGDLIVCIRATIGKVAVAEKPYCLGRGVAGLRPSKLDQKLLRYFLISQATAMDEAGTGTTFRQIDKKTLSSWPVPLPPPDVQPRLIAKLDTLFVRSESARDELARIPRLVERYKQAILKAGYTKAQAEAREVTTLGRVAKEVRNGVSRKPENAPPGIPILKISAVRSMVVRMDERRYYVPAADEDVSRYELRVGDLLFTRYNGNPDLVANCGMMQNLNGQKHLIYPDKLIRVRIDPGLADPAFIEAICASPQVRSALAPFIKSAAGQHGISGTDLKDHLPIPLPPMAQQRQITRNIQQGLVVVNGIAVESGRASALIDRLEQATLSKAFQGELVT